jgi:hypothetical protein
MSVFTALYLLQTFEENGIGSIEPVVVPQIPAPQIHGRIEPQIYQPSPLAC